MYAGYPLEQITILLFVSLALVCALIALRFPAVKKRVSRYFSDQLYRQIQLYLLALLAQFVLLGFVWYINLSLLHLVNVLAPFATSLLIMTLLFGDRAGLASFILIAPFIFSLLVKPFIQPDHDVVFVLGYQAIVLLASIFIGSIIRRYQSGLYTRLDIMQEIHWRTRKDLSAQLVQKAKEEATLKSIHEASLAIEPVHLAFNKVLPAIAKQSCHLVAGETAGIVLLKTESDITIFSTRYTHAKQQAMGHLVKDICRSKKRLSISVVRMTVTEELLRRHHLTRQELNQLLFVMFDVHRKGVLFVGRSIENSTFTDTDEQKLQLFAAHASLAIRNAQHHESLTALMHARDQFASVVAHELKTPLSTIKLYAQLYVGVAKEAGLQDVQKGLDMIDNEVDKITKIVNSILDFTRIQSRKFSLDRQNFQLVKLLQDRVTLFQSLYPDHTFVFESRPKNAPITADKIRIDQVITNILTNAVKYSPTKTAITVNLTQGPTIYAIAISDQGIGIAREELSSIFEPFFQAKNRYTHQMRSKKGVGLGLFIAKGIIKRHKGSIVVASQINKGTTFTISLPKG